MKLGFEDTAEVDGGLVGRKPTAGHNVRVANGMEEAKELCRIRARSHLRDWGRYPACCYTEVRWRKTVGSRLSLPEKC